MGIYAGAAVAACLSLMRTATAVPSAPEPLGAQDFPLSLPFGEARRSAERGGGGPPPRTLLLVAALPTAATLLFEWTTGQTPGNWTRAVSGVPLGAAAAWIVSGAPDGGEGLASQRDPRGAAPERRNDREHREYPSGE
jgi:hypothetical protein